jgi:hypothetical protein
MEDLTSLFRTGKLYFLISIIFIILTLVGLAMIRNLIKVLRSIDIKLGKMGNGKSDKADYKSKAQDN